MHGIDFHPELRRAARMLPRQVVTPVTLPLIRRASRLMWRRAPAPDVEVLTLESGVGVRLFRPAGVTRPSPALLWIHGGPLMSWNSWSWRWCPWLMAARGYAVLMPNPALSQGFGQDFIRRGWGEWGGAPYTDLMTAVDAVEQRPDIDASRTAAMGGSFGGYMANWIATQTDRFRAIVTHASLWDLDAFTGTADAAYYWEKEWGEPLTEPKREPSPPPPTLPPGNASTHVVENAKSQALPSAAAVSHGAFFLLLMGTSLRLAPRGSPDLRSLRPSGLGR